MIIHKRFFIKQYDRVKRLLEYLFSLLIRCFVGVHNRRIVCWCFAYNQYGCNPKYITQYILNHNEDNYEIWWVFKKGIDTSGVDNRVKIVLYNSLKYFIVINTAKIVISNCRTNPYLAFWKKRKSQIYVMTWHSSMGIKKIEKDAEFQLEKSAVRTCKIDSKKCDLILSGCKFRTEVIRRSFWYSGEILEKGTPRNDILFTNPMHIKNKFCREYGIDIKDKLLLYAPTFRKNLKSDYYDIDWQKLLPLIEKKWENSFTILFRLHPSYAAKIERTNVKDKKIKIIDVTTYLDMQELLLISDVLITDYSSSMFDFMLMKKPCFLYMKDYKSYDRGFYFKIEDLPFPVSFNNEQLGDLVRDFDNEIFIEKLLRFDREVLGSYEKGDAASHFYNWLKNRVHG